MPYETIEDTNYGFKFDDCDTEFVSDSDYFESLENDEE